ncbi:hypothetical protein E6W17_27125 [Streptomyces sp. A1547]|nr:hypothetical protein E6W17_27125 [Streptomyces sp. A1547]
MGPVVVVCGKSSKRGGEAPSAPTRPRIVPVMRRSARGVRLRALTLSGCPRMLQVALRACAPQT